MVIIETSAPKCRFLVRLVGRFERTAHLVVDRCLRPPGACFYGRARQVMSSLGRRPVTR